MTNTWQQPLVLADPKLASLRFTDRRNKTRRWFNNAFVSASHFAFVLEPFGSQDFQLEARYADIIPEIPNVDFDFQRFSVDLPAGACTVRYEYRIDDNFYDGDTHTRLSDLMEMADESNATAWTGEVVSNTLSVTKPSS